MDKLDRMYGIKKFFKAIYKDLNDEEFIRIVQIDENNKIRINFFNDIDELVKFCSSNCYNINTYFQIATTNGESGRIEDLKYRYCLAFDFDKKDFENLTHKEIIRRFQEAGLWYHALVDSGNGYHAYMIIERTKDLKKVEQVQKALAIKLKADLNAIKNTQILRVPYTFNLKHLNDIKQVNIVKVYEKNTIKRYDINNLYKRFCYDKFKEIDNKDNNVTELVFNTTNIPDCVKMILEKGSKKGNRNSDLQKIIVTLRNRNKSFNQIQRICQEWNNKNTDSLLQNELDYQIKYIYDNLKNCSYDCDKCFCKKDCFSTILSDFKYLDNENLITMNETHMRSLRASKRKGVKIMESNDLLVYCILKNHNDGLYRDEIIEDMTYKKKCRFSDKTLTKALSNLEENGFIKIEAVGKKKLYMVSSTKNKVELTYNVSFAATYECIKGTISTEELRLYNYMRYIHNYTQRNNPKALKGNLLQVNQIDLAKDLGITQGRVSQMIHNLIEEKMLGVWYRQASKNNGFDFNIYRLNY